MPPSPSSAAESKVGEASVAERSFLGIAHRLARALDRPYVGTAATVLAVVGAAGLLLARLAPDVRGKPLFDDEVIAGLTAVHPVREMLEIVLSDRGGAPLHFVLAHAALALDPSPAALRWLSVVLALVTVPVCYDLGRRIGGRVAGAIAAIVTAASSMLAVYGSVGRMYALFAFVSALAIDLFVRALERRTPRAASVAIAAAWLLPAVHPYGMVVVVLEAAVALAVWRGRPLRPALPALALAVALAVALVPFVLADVRLSERFGVGVGEPASVAPPDVAADQLGEAIAAFAGGSGWLALAFFGIALAGVFTVARRNVAFAVFALAALAAIPVLMVVAKAEEELVHQLSPRHLMFALPVWAALIGAGAARLVHDLPRSLAVGALAAVAAAAVFAPSGIGDPRVDADSTAASLARPADWVRGELDPGAVLFFYSPVYLAALPETSEATPIPRSGRPLRMVERARLPAPSIMLSLPLAGTRVNGERINRRLPPGSKLAVFPDWLLVDMPGPFADEREVLAAARDGLTAIRLTTRRRSYTFRQDLRGGLATVCDALAALAEPCPPRIVPGDGR
ncbi:MAG: glycosyltransferase family 39 protein [Actinomycetota bacterium]|nr:glycosyltransferase family 39 protein [Actinomycetota bacterium]